MGMQVIFRVFTVLFLALSVIGSAAAGYVGNDPLNYTDPTGKQMFITGGQPTPLDGYAAMIHAEPDPQRKQELMNESAVVGSAVTAVGVGTVLAAPYVATTLPFMAPQVEVALVAQDSPVTPQDLVKPKIKRRTTRNGEPGVRIENPDGTVKDITPKRVKEFEPNTHPNAPPGAMQRRKFENAQPGSKGYKRDPTPEELDKLKPDE